MWAFEPGSRRQLAHWVLLRDPNPVEVKQSENVTKKNIIPFFSTFGRVLQEMR
jgi:hypothetical protein